MTELNGFKSGKDLTPETAADDDETVTCVDCGTRESDEAAYEQGWQLAPPVCSDCLKWTFVGGECCTASG